MTTDLAANARARRVRKRATPVSVTFTHASGTMDTLEGSIGYNMGDAIVTGVQGERWPVAREQFLERYEALAGTTPGQNGTYSRLPEAVYALQITAEDNPPVDVATRSGGVLRAEAGDWVVQYGPADCGVVDEQIFAETYETLP